MAKRLLGPWSVLYPVRFYSGGDTTRQAFGKHIQEIARIYGLLNALDAGKAGSDEIADVVANITHNDLSGLEGGGGGHYFHLSREQIDKLEGAAGADDVIRTHNRLQGLQGGMDGNFYHLSRAQYDGLADLLLNNSGGVVEDRIGDAGYILFGNGLMIEWGNSPANGSASDAQVDAVTFPMAFVEIFTALVSTWTAEARYDNDWWYQVTDVTVRGMKVIRNTANRNTAVETQATWIAIGRGK